MEKTIELKFRKDLKKHNIVIKDDKVEVIKEEAYYLVKAEKVDFPTFDNTLGRLHAIYTIKGEKIFGIEDECTIWAINGHNFKTIHYDPKEKYHCTHYHIEQNNIKKGWDFTDLEFVKPNDKGYLINDYLVVIIRNYRRYLYNMDTCQIMSFPFDEISTIYGNEHIPYDDKLLVKLTAISQNNRLSVNLVGLIDFNGNFVSPLVNESTLESYPTTDMIIDDLADLLNGIEADLNKLENTKPVTTIDKAAVLQKILEESNNGKN